MTLKTTSNAGPGKGPVQSMKHRLRQRVETDGGPRPGEVKVTIVYNYQGRDLTETRFVPRAVIYAMQDPGETSIAPVEAMDSLAAFHKDALKGELKELSINGGTSIPGAAISAQLQRAYDVHAVCAATSKGISRSLFLQHAEVQKLMKATAAVLCGVSPDEITRLAEDEQTIWVARTITEVTHTPKIGLRMQRVECDCGSHKEYKNITLPGAVSVDEAKTRQEQRIARAPQAGQMFDRACSKIEELRGGNPLSKTERDIVATKINLDFVKNPENRLIITP